MSTHIDNLRVINKSRVLITGHNGFKGSWLTLWLLKLGSSVAGYALEPDSSPCHFSSLNLDVDETYGDIRNFDTLKKKFSLFKPDIVFHLAAQPIVRRSYREPLYTLETNVIGTSNVLECCRLTPSVKAAVIITSDKCYENTGWEWGYREADNLGGHDTYSTSKACAELIVQSYRRSFPETLTATCRSGNVVGGGDWSNERLVPDIMRAVTRGVPSEIRNPEATRPWIHVLEPLRGYILLGAHLLSGHEEFCLPFNFGPDPSDIMKVKDVISLMKISWPDISSIYKSDLSNSQEAAFLTLDSTRAAEMLGWSPFWNCSEAFSQTVDWYRSYIESNKLVTENQLLKYMEMILP